MNLPSKTFCILPWMHLATNASGNLRVCCNSSPGKNFINKPDGTPYKIWKDDVSEAWNSPTYTEIRKQLLNGERPDICERCFREEDSGVRSARQSWNESWGYDDNFEIVAQENFKYIDIRLGNLCNLKCRMCNPYSSSQWVDEWHLVEKQLNEDEQYRLKNMNWFDNELVWDNILKNADTIEEIYLTGGEPTLAVSQYRLFDKLIELDLAKKIRLKYNTNMTNIPTKMIDYWQHFKKIKINASIDAYGDLNRYIRFPTAWQSVEKNLAIFKEMRERGKCNLQIHITVQAYNVMHLSELFDYLTEIDATDIYLNILNHPDYLNIRALPQELKQLTADRLANYTHIKKVDSTLKYMWAEDWSDRLPAMADYTFKIDESRKQDCRNYSIELGEYLYDKYTQ